MEQVLENNIFEFDKELFLQEIGSAMGTVAAPNYSNLFMGNKLDQKIREVAALYGEGVYPLRLFRRFIDDCFILWTGSKESLDKFLDHINTLHPTIKFTSTHSYTNISFLDISVSIVNNTLVTDLCQVSVSPPVQLFSSHNVQIHSLLSRS